MAAAWPPQLWLAMCCLLAVAHSARMDAVRLDGGARRSSDPLSPQVIAELDASVRENAAKAMRERDLRTASEFVETVEISEHTPLASIAEVMERFEAIRTRMLCFGASKDSRTRQRVRDVLKAVRQKSENLRVWAAMRAAEGFVDDGGDKLPSERDTICRFKSNFVLSADFVEHLDLLCEFLDSNRVAIAAGEQNESAAFAVAGVASTICNLPEYKMMDVGWNIDILLGEERRWSLKQMRQRSHVRGKSGVANSSPLGDGSSGDLPFDAWKTGVLVMPHVDTSTWSWRSPIEASQVAHNTTMNEFRNWSLNALRITALRLDFAKTRLVTYVTSSSPAFRKRIRYVLQLIKQKVDECKLIAAQKHAAGEVDIAGLKLPSQRDNICGTLPSFHLEPHLHEDVRLVCDAMDRLHELTMANKNKDVAMFETLGRIAKLKRKKEYWLTPVPTELEILLADEWGWLGAWESEFLEKQKQQKQPQQQDQEEEEK